MYFDKFSEGAAQVFVTAQDEGEVSATLMLELNTSFWRSLK